MKYLLLCMITSILLSGAHPIQTIVTGKPAIANPDLPQLAIDSLFVLQHNDSLLSAFYRQNNFRTFWSESNRSNAISALAQAPKDGLMVEDYWVKELQNFEYTIDTMTADRMVAFDLLLTRAIQKYLIHLACGKLDPSQLYDDWILERPVVDINSLIGNSNSVDSMIESCRPPHYFYKSLRDALAMIEKYPEIETDTIALSSKITVGSRNVAMINIKKRLIYWKDLTSPDSLTSQYDCNTFDAIKRFQRRNGLKQDGVIGPATISTLNRSKQLKREQIIANLERWRWFPRDMSNHYVVVNIPAFKLAVIRDGDTVETKKVVVGTKERKTPVLSSVFNNIILNPTWTVPPTILREDLVPSAIKSRRYFYEKQITIYDRNNSPISPYQWDPNKSTHYRYVQKPGNHNALGNVKFNFPNNLMVYLHDTNTKSHFSRNHRSLSSGCVRVEDPLPLAVYLINDKHWTLEQVKKVVASRKTVSVPLKDHVKIHQLYWTAWLSHSGELIFREDIYNLDPELYLKLRS